ncbi:MAG TPA: AtpZ/AtpI family protein [Acidimicrobiales bacterium]|jgi:F0F1-type ATP synthase assembly protein I|nr:AtpZ/AtpI family protein [Acidimicrobiales bacterium]
MDDPHPKQPGEEASSGERTPLLGPGAVAFLTLGVAWAVALAAGGGIGYLIDRWAGTGPIFTLVGLLLGLVLAVLITIDRVRKYL